MYSYLLYVKCLAERGEVGENGLVKGIKASQGFNPHHGNGVLVTDPGIKKGIKFQV